MSFTALFSISTILAGCSDSDPCANSIVREAASPDGKYIATAFIRDCGATTDFSPQVSLRHAGEPMPVCGNVYIGNHSQKIDLHWASAAHLIIESEGQMVSEMKSFEGVKIERKDKY